MADMGEELFAKQAPARPDKNSLQATPAPAEPAKKTAKKKA